MKRLGHGFTLIEVSIVLVIIGLLTAGVLVGRTLIAQAELRKLIRQIDSYNVAVHTFRLKYNALPGDYTSAETIWGTDPNGCPTGAHNTYSTPPVTCNGNGDGVIGDDTPVDTPVYDIKTAEWNRFWQHLANANLISGAFLSNGRYTNPGADTYPKIKPLSGGGIQSNSMYFIILRAGYVYTTLSSVNGVLAALRSN